MRFEEIILILQAAWCLEFGLFLASAVLPGLAVGVYDSRFSDLHDHSLLACGIWTVAFFAIYYWSLHGNPRWGWVFVVLGAVGAVIGSIALVGSHRFARWMARGCSDVSHIAGRGEVTK